MMSTNLDWKVLDLVAVSSGNNLENYVPISSLEIGR